MARAAHYVTPKEIQNYLDALWRRVLCRSPWFTFSCGFALGAVIVLIITWKDMSTASVGLLGVLLGAAISAAASFLLALEGRRAQIATATWSRRLEAHQKAFVLWHRCWEVVHDRGEEKGKALGEAQRWWVENCLFLSEEARNAFRIMTMCVSMHTNFLDMMRNARDKKSLTDDINENWEKIVGTGQILMEGSGGHISDDVIKNLGPPKIDDGAAKGRVAR